MCTVAGRRDVRGLCRGLARDVTAMRAQRPELKVAHVTDGASEFETLYEQHLATPLGPGVVSLPGPRDVDLIL